MQSTLDWRDKGLQNCTCTNTLPRSGSQRFVLKRVPQKELKYFKDNFDVFRSSPYIRVPGDTIPKHSIPACKYLQDHLLSFSQKDVSLPTTERILRDASREVAALHDKVVVRTYLKADKILMD